MDGDKIERKYLAHYIDGSFRSAVYERIGKDLEEYNIELNPDVETTKNIIGENSTNVKGYEVSGSVDTYYAREGSELFENLMQIINDRSTGSQLETTVVDVLVNASGTVINAYREDAVVVPQSFGGDTGGVQIPYEIHYNGNRTEGTWDTATKAFTPSSSGT